jgi:hypothetical protein
MLLVHVLCCHAVLCCAVLCCAVLCYAVLFRFLWGKHEGDHMQLTPMQSMLSGFSAAFLGPIATGQDSCVRTRGGGGCATSICHGCCMWQALLTCQPCSTTALQACWEPAVSQAL